MSAWVTRTPTRPRPEVVTTRPLNTAARLYKEIIFSFFGFFGKIFLINFKVAMLIVLSHVLKSLRMGAYLYFESKFYVKLFIP